MADLLVLTPSTDGATAVLPALALLSHRTRVVAPEPAAMLDAFEADVLVIDARFDLAEARNNCRLVQVTGVTVPLLLVLRDGGMSIVTAEWGGDDVVQADASPAEVEARSRLRLGRASLVGPPHNAAAAGPGALAV